MHVLGIIFVIYGGFLMLALLLQFPFVYNNFKSKALIAKMGKKTFNYVVFAMGLIFLIIGILLL